MRWRCWLKRSSSKAASKPKPVPSALRTRFFWILASNRGQDRTLIDSGNHLYPEFGHRRPGIKALNVVKRRCCTLAPVAGRGRSVVSGPVSMPMGLGVDWDKACSVSSVRAKTAICAAQFHDIVGLVEHILEHARQVIARDGHHHNPQKCPLRCKARLSWMVHWPNMAFHGNADIQPSEPAPGHAPRVLPVVRWKWVACGCP